MYVLKQTRILGVHIKIITKYYGLLFGDIV